MYSCAVKHGSIRWPSVVCGSGWWRPFASGSGATVVACGGSRTEESAAALAIVVIAVSPLFRLWLSSVGGGRFRNGRKG